MRLQIYSGLLLAMLITVFPLISMGVNESDKNNHKIDLYESLYSAIEMDRANEVEQFIHFGAEINHRFDGNKTPLMIASQIGSISVVRTLLELGADPNLVSAENLTALDYAKNKNDAFIVAVLKTGQNPASTDATTAELIDIEPNNSITEIKSSYKPKTTNIYKPKVASLPKNYKTNESAKDEVNRIGKRRDITGSYEAKTTARFSECGIYEKTIEYLAEESINKQLKNGKFVIAYTAPLIQCKGKGKLSADNATLKGNYNCSYSTESGFKGSLRMKFKGVMKDNEIHMNYIGHDTSPGVSCNYQWDRVLIVRN